MIFKKVKTVQHITVNNNTIRDHPVNEWLTIRDELIVKVSDGKIEVFEVLKLKINQHEIMKKMLMLEDSSIKKNELKALLVSGAWGSRGTVIIEGIGHSAI